MYTVERNGKKLFIVFKLDGHTYKVEVTGCPQDFIESIYKAKVKSLKGEQDGKSTSNS